MVIKSYIDFYTAEFTTFNKVIVLQIHEYRVRRYYCIFKLVWSRQLFLPQVSQLDGSSHGSHFEKHWLETETPKNQLGIDFIQTKQLINCFSLNSGIIGKCLLYGFTSSSFLGSHFCIWFISWYYVSEKPNHSALCNVCTPTILLTREAWFWLGILFCLTIEKTYKDNSPVQLGRCSNKDGKNKKNKLLNDGRPRFSWESQNPAQGT